MKFREVNQAKKKMVRTGSMVKTSELLVVQVKPAPMEVTMMQDHCIIKFLPGFRRCLMERETEQGTGFMKLPV